MMFIVLEQSRKQLMIHANWELRQETEGCFLQEGLDLKADEHGSLKMLWFAVSVADSNTNKAGSFCKAIIQRYYRRRNSWREQEETEDERTNRVNFKRWWQNNSDLKVQFKARTVLEMESEKLDRSKSLTAINNIDEPSCFDHSSCFLLLFGIQLLHTDVTP